MLFLSGMGNLFPALQCCNLMPICCHACCTMIISCWWGSLGISHTWRLDIGVLHDTAWKDSEVLLFALFATGFFGYYTVLIFCIE